MSDADCTPGREPRSIATSSLWSVVSPVLSDDGSESCYLYVACVFVYG